jgi:hypothetical protein
MSSYLMSMGSKTNLSKTKTDLIGRQEGREPVWPFHLEWVTVNMCFICHLTRMGLLWLAFCYLDIGRGEASVRSAPQGRTRALSL